MILKNWVIGVVLFSKLIRHGPRKRKYINQKENKIEHIECQQNVLIKKIQQLIKVVVMDAM